MSGPVYDIAKRAVNAYINTGSIPAVRRYAG